MYTLIAENKYGQQLELTHNDAYVIESIDGLDPPDAVINVTKNAGADGSVFNSSYIDNRQITITLAINGPAEDNRINLYRYFKSKHPVRLYYQNNSRNVYIDGYVERMQIEFFEMKQIAQITVFCPMPFFNASDDVNVEFSNVISAFEFPFSVEDSANLLDVTAESTTSTGITFTVNDDGSVGVDGMATQNTYLVLGSVSLVGGQTYALNGCPLGGGNSTYRLYWQGVSGNYDEGEGTTYTPSEDTTINIRIVVYSGARVSNLTFYPMVRAASIESDDFMEFGNPDGLIEFSTISINNEAEMVNGGDVETGAVIELRATGNVSNPIVYSVDAGESFGLTTNMILGDTITINTKRKEKAVTLLRNGAATNLIGSIKEGSTWFQLVPGENVFTVSADTNPENILCSITITNQYEGV